MDFMSFRKTHECDLSTRASLPMRRIAEEIPRNQEEGPSSSLADPSTWSRISSAKDDSKRINMSHHDTVAKTG